jgi:hypothetical protein
MNVDFIYLYTVYHVCFFSVVGSSGITTSTKYECQTKTRTGEKISDVREVSPKMYECSGDRNPVALYELYASKHPTGMRDQSDPFYIATPTISLTGTEGSFDNGLFCLPLK